MYRLRMALPLSVVVCLLTACQPNSTPLAPTALPPTTAPTAAPTLAPTTAPTATLAASPTTAPTAIQSTATATADAGILATQIELTNAWGVAFDAGGSLYVSTCGYAPMTRIDPSGLAKAYAGGSLGFAGDGGPALLAYFVCMGGIAFGPDGSPYAGEQGNNRVRRITPDSTISTVNL